MEKALDTPAHIYYKYEGVSPAGSHKPNTSVPQAFYNAAQVIDKVTTEASRMVKDPRYAYYDFESQFNRAGYNLLGDKQFDAALFVFDMNVKLFPNSPNAWLTDWT